MAPSVTASGITTDNSTGERHIPASTRADGSQRREIRVRPGYRPPEDVELYKNRAAASFRNRAAAGVPGAEGLKGNASSVTPATSAAAGTASNKNAKKREAKRKAKAADGESNDTAQGDSAASKQPTGALEKESWRPGMNNVETAAAAAAEETVDPEVEKEKKARNLKKKLRQARELREKKDSGENLLPEQFEKVIKMQELIRQLDLLGFDANGEKKQVDQTTAAKDEKDAAV